MNTLLIKSFLELAESAYLMFAPIEVALLNNCFDKTSKEMSFKIFRANFTVLIANFSVRSWISILNYAPKAHLN